MGRLFIANMVAGWALGMLLAALPGRAWAANVGTTVWEDADPEATARAVQVHLIRLASADVKQVEQARLGLESLGLNALAPLQAALADPDRPAAEQEKIQALVKQLLNAVAVTVLDADRRPFVGVTFQVRQQSWTAAAERPAAAAAADAPETVTTATTDAQGRLVLFRPVGAVGGRLTLTRRDIEPCDGLRFSAVCELQFQPETVAAATVQLPRGVRPPLAVRNQAGRPVPHAAVVFIPADEATARASRWMDRPFRFDGPLGVRDPGDLSILEPTRVWNPLTALQSGVGCCSPLTDEEGLVQVGRLAPGKYALHILAAGYARFTVPEFVVPETVAEDAEPTVLKLQPTPRSFCAGTLKTAEGKPLKHAIAFLLPAEQVYDPAHILELADHERRRAAQRRAETIRAGKNPDALPPPPPVPAYSAEHVPLEYIEEIKNDPQVRAARVANATGRIEFRELAAGQYVLRVFVGTADSMEPADLREYRPVDGPAPPTLSAKDGAPIDLGALQYKQAPAATLDPPTAPLPGETPPPAEKGAAP